MKTLYPHTSRSLALIVVLLFVFAWLFSPPVHAHAGFGRSGAIGGSRTSHFSSSGGLSSFGHRSVTPSYPTEAYAPMGSTMQPRTLYRVHVYRQPAPPPSVVIVHHYGYHNYYPVPRPVYIDNAPHVIRTGPTVIDNSPQYASANLPPNPFWKHFWVTVLVCLIIAAFLFAGFRLFTVKK